MDVLEYEHGGIIRTLTKNDLSGPSPSAAAPLAKIPAAESAKLAANPAAAPAPKSPSSTVFAEI